MIGKILAVGFVCVGAALGQTASVPADVGASSGANSVQTSSATPAATTAAPAKAYAFDVVSIRQNISELPGDFTGPTADGYHMANVSLVVPMRAAYVPLAGGATYYTQDQMQGLPDWMNENYDIDARIAEEDRAEWQKPESQKVMLRAMLQALLADRCKLAVHREVKEVGVRSLVVAKGGPKFKRTDPAVEHPDGVKLSWGGVMVYTQGGVSFYGTTMASFASFLSSMSNGGRPVQDRTGLTGQYDLILKVGSYAGPATNAPQDGISASDPGGSMIVPLLNGLGLKLESAKGQVETLVIDHMERPSAN